MSREIIEALAWALIHFTWQGALVGLAAALACETMRAARPSSRYGVLVLALAVMAATPVVTTLYLLSAPAVTVVPAPGEPLEALAAVTTPPAAPASIAAALPSPPSGAGWLAALVACWSGIAAFLSLRSFGGWLKVQRLAHRDVGPASSLVERIATDLRFRLGIDRAVRVVHSSVAEVPGVVGWMKPVILLPVSLATALTPEQIEQILAHELAHVRRHDYLVNLFQTAVENILFYHPAVWWISRRVRVERENCCDDLAVATCGDPIAYARTLARLETMRGAAPALLPAASGGALLSRVRRLLGQDATRRTVPAWFGAVVPLAIVALALVSVPAPQAETETPAPVAASAPTPDAKDTPAPVAASARTPDAKGTPAPVAASAPTPDAKGTPAPVAASAPTPDAKDTPAPVAASAPTPGAKDTPAPVAAPAPTPAAKDTPAPEAKGSSARSSDGYLAGLTDAGYTHISVEDIIRLKHNGVEPRYIKRMLAAGLGPLDVDQIIRLRSYGVTPEFTTSVVGSGLAKGLDVENVIQLRNNGVDGAELRRIRGLGFGPYAVADIIRLRHNGVDASTFEALKEAGGTSAEDAIRFRQNGVTPQTIREARSQGFANLTVEQILKLHSAGVI
jgi:bla regulator protein blaR1